MKSLNINFAILILLIFLFTSSAVAQFTADMVMTENDMTKTTKLIVEDPYYRMEMEEGGQQLCILVNKDKQITDVVMPDQKMYMEISSSSMQSASNDVFQSIEKQKSTYDTKMVGKETVNGYECEKYEISDGGKLLSTYWQSAELDFPIKVVSGVNQNMIMELKNIKMGDVDDSLFKVPDGYMKMDMPGME